MLLSRPQQADKKALQHDLDVEGDILVFLRLQVWTRARVNRDCTFM